MQFRRFFDYLDANGNNVAHDWLHDLPTKARAKMQRLIFALERERIVRHTDMKPLKGNCQGLLELRMDHLKVEYRLLGCKLATKSEIPAILLLMGAEERNGRFVPPTACDTARQRKRLAEANPGRRICAHQQD